MINFIKLIKKNMFFLGIAGQFVPYILFTGLIMVFSLGNFTDTMVKTIQPIQETICCISNNNYSYNTINQHYTNNKVNIANNKFYSHFYIPFSENNKDISIISEKDIVKSNNFLFYTSYYTEYYSGLAPPVK